MPKTTKKKTAGHMLFDFQQVILGLKKSWVDQDCLIWYPDNVRLGVGTTHAFR
jgi:glycyl-tRNA synthetase alpha subunit